MGSFAKIAWAILLATLTFGVWTFPLLALMLAAEVLKGIRRLRS